MPIGQGTWLEKWGTISVINLNLVVMYEHLKKIVNIPRLNGLLQPIFETVRLTELNTVVWIIVLTYFKVVLQYQIIMCFENILDFWFIPVLILKPDISYKVTPISQIVHDRKI